MAETVRLGFVGTGKLRSRSWKSKLQDHRSKRMKGTVVAEPQPGEDIETGENDGTE